MLCLGLVAIPGVNSGTSVTAQDATATLSQQLHALVQGSLEIELWSQLPQGSGMGTSSILAGTILAALARVCGYEYSHNALVHLVLVLEQMLTTGGEWRETAMAMVSCFTVVVLNCFVLSYCFFAFGIFSVGD